jgi:hypothetical protein
VPDYGWLYHANVGQHVEPGYSNIRTSIHKTPTVRRLDIQHPVIHHVKAALELDPDLPLLVSLLIALLGEKEVVLLEVIFPRGSHSASCKLSAYDLRYSARTCLLRWHPKSSGASRWP